MKLLKLGLSAAWWPYFFKAYMTLTTVHMTIWHAQKDSNIKLVDNSLLTMDPGNLKSAFLKVKVRSQLCGNVGVL